MKFLCWMLIFSQHQKLIFSPFFLPGVYMTVTLIVLINLLIAMMSNTYQRIEAQSDIEWKFGRAKLIRNMNRTLSTPSPINLFIGIPVLHVQIFLQRKGICHHIEMHRFKFIIYAYLIVK